MVAGFFHVSREALQEGWTLKPTCLARTCHIFFPAIQQALDQGPEAVQDLLRNAKLDPIQSPGSRRLSTVLIEYIFEEVRAMGFPNRPRRLQSVFLFSSESAVRRYLTNYARERWWIYKCIVERGDQFFANMALINRIEIDIDADMEPQLVAIKQTARRYWAGGKSSNMDWPEVLVVGHVSVDTQVRLS